MCRYTGNKVSPVYRLLSFQQCMVFLTMFVITKHHWYINLYTGSSNPNHKQRFRGKGDRINETINSYAEIATQRQTMYLLYHLKAQYASSTHLLPQTSRPPSSKVCLWFLYIGLLLYVIPICLFFDILCLLLLLWRRDALIVRVRRLLS